MTLASVAIGDPVQASTFNQLIANVNSSPAFIAFGSNTVWSVPAGVHKFKVSLTGGGGFGVSAGDVDNPYFLQGRSGVMAMVYFSGVDIGTSFAITVGAGGTSGTPHGGATSFGASFSVPGGRAGNDSGAFEPATFPSGQPNLYGGTPYLFPWGTGLRASGTGGDGNPTGDGHAGIVIIEW